MTLVAGIDLGGTAINYTFLDPAGRFLFDDLCEFPARATEGPAICLKQIQDGLHVAARRAGVAFENIVSIGLDTPGPASAAGVLSQRGSTNFVHPDWASFDLCAGLSAQLGRPVTYLNDGNAAALWGHYKMCGAREGTTITAVIGTGLGGGIVIDGRVVAGRLGFGGELGHVLVPYERLAELHEVVPVCNCGRIGDLESICSLTAIERTLLPAFLRRFPDHLLAAEPDMRSAARRVRGMADQGDAMCRAIFAVQAKVLGLFFDMMINVFDPDVLLVGGGALEASASFQEWFLNEIRSAMPAQREEQTRIRLRVMPNGDTASARGAALQASAAIC